MKTYREALAGLRREYPLAARLVRWLLISAFSFQLSAFGAVAHKGAHTKPIVINYFGRHVINFPDATLWSMSEIAQTKWPKVGTMDCALIRARGSAGDRTNRNYLVINRATRRVIKPNAKYFVRPDPWAGLPQPPRPEPRPEVRSAKVEVRAAKSFTPHASLLTPRFVDVLCSAPSTEYAWGTWVLERSTNGVSWTAIATNSTPHFFGIAMDAPVGLFRFRQD